MTSYVCRTTLTSLLLLGASHLSMAKDVSLTAAQAERMEIRLAEVKPASTEAIALLPGTVIPAMHARIAAAAPFAGTVLKVLVLPGQQVAKGESLAVIASRELLDAQAQLKQAEAELQSAQAVAQRKRSLADKNIASPVLAEEAEAQVAKLQAVRDQYRRTLALVGITVGEGGQYTVTASDAGVVVETPAMPGSKLDAMAPAVTIDTSSDVWIEVQVPAELVGRIQPNNPVQVIDGPEGRVVSIAGALDRMTRSATMLVSVSTDVRLLPGQMVTLTIKRETDMGGLEVPPAAVAWIDNRHAVFVKGDAGFTMTPVTLRGKSLTAATVAGDVAPGQMVAASGLPQLEALMGGE